MDFENVIAFIFLFYLRRQLKTKEIPGEMEETN
jgi:hypothetical protein